MDSSTEVGDKIDGRARGWLNVDVCPLAVPGRINAALPNNPILVNSLLLNFVAILLLLFMKKEEICHDIKTQYNDYCHCWIMCCLLIRDARTVYIRLNTLFNRKYRAIQTSTFC